MARSKPTKETIENAMSAVLKEAKANKKLPELLAAILKEMHQKDPDATRKVLDALIEQTAMSMPEDRRQAFLEELLALAQPN
jgi:predicted solute-binding protein